MLHIFITFFGTQSLTRKSIHTKINSAYFHAHLGIFFQNDYPEATFNQQEKWVAWERW